jgi:NADPH:quinone reductase-like Zn-dependent oxidoreductase
LPNGYKLKTVYFEVTYERNLCTKYRPLDVLQFKEVEKPRPGNNEVRIKIYAVPVTAMDVRIRGLNVLLGVPVYGKTTV